jgi:anti-sigma B factor antagonist
MSHMLASSSQSQERSECTLAVRVLTHGTTDVTLELDGECDLASADLVTAVLDDQLRLGRRMVRLDLAGVKFLDATGLQAIVAARNELLARGGRLVLQRPSRQVARLLRITRLDTVLTVVPGIGGRARQ